MRDFGHFARLLLRGKRAKGQIVRDDLVTGLRSPLHYPVVAFRDEAGRRYEVRSRFPSETSFQDQSREIAVAYDPDRPHLDAEAILPKILWPMIMMILYFLAIAAAIPLLLIYVTP